MAVTSTAYLELNIKGYESGISSALSMIKKLAIAFAGFKGVSFLKDGIQDAITFGNEMYHAAQKMGGIDPGNLLIAQKALENAGLSAGEAQSELNRMIESGQKLSTLFQGGNVAGALAAAAKSYGSQASILSRAAEKLSKVFELMESIGNKVKTYFLAMTTEFVKPLTAALEYLNEIDLAEMGSNFGKKINEAAQILVGLYKNQDLGLALGLSLKVGFMNAVEWLSKALHALFDSGGIGEQMGDTLGRWANAFKELFIGIADAISSAILNAVSKAMHGIAEMLPEDLGGKMHASATSVFLYGRDASRESKSHFEQAKASFGNEGVGGFFSGLITGITTETEKARLDLAAVIGKASMVGAGIIDAEAAKSGEKFKLNQAALGKQEPYKVIADSMARVGGGGGYIVASQTMEQRNQMKMIQGQALQTEQLVLINQGVQKFAKPVMQR